MAVSLCSPGIDTCLKCSSFQFILTLSLKSYKLHLLLPTFQNMTRSRKWDITNLHFKIE